MLQSHQRLFHRTILCTDAGVLACGAWFARGSASLEPFAVEAAALGVAWFAWTRHLGVYRSHRTAARGREFRALVGSLLGALAVAVLVGQVVHGGGAIDPLAFGLFGALPLLALRFSIRTALRTLRRRGQNYRRLLVVGGGVRADSIAAEVGGHPELGIRVAGFLAFRGQRETVADVAERGGVDDLQRVLADEAIDVVVVCPPSNATSAQIEQVVELCGAAGIRCQIAPDFLRLDENQADLEWYGSVPVLDPAPARRVGVQYAVKSLLDFVGAAVGITLLAPVLLAIAVAIKLDSRGPVLFRQRRVGRAGQHFWCLKFRTMRIDAEELRAELEAQNEQDGPVFKIARDPRITRIGRFLRKYSLDELPQLFNVLRGEMSLVGPRPPIPDEVDRYEWWQRRRVSVRPGLTCIWQVDGRNRVSFQEWMEMDLDYLENWSLWLDLKILCGTAGTVLRGTGS